MNKGFMGAFRFAAIRLISHVMGVEIWKHHSIELDPPVEDKKNRE